MTDELKKGIAGFFIGKDDVVENILICMFTGGHVLLEDVPGVGKTTLARTVARAVSCDFGRIQFTPDTLPGDVIGNEIYNMKSGQFEFREGAVMHQIILADEINRTSPKTQSSLLEAMAEGQITVGNVKRMLPQPFMVIATQNPVEFMGTYPLPEAQMDRFMMKLTLGYPSQEEEIRLARNMIDGITPDAVKPVCSAEDVLKIREEISKVTVKDEILGYIREIIDLTRHEKNFVLGASPRAMLALTKASQARAYMQGRDFVKPDDVKTMVPPVLGHRITLTSEARIAKESVTSILSALLFKAKVPTM